MKQREEMTPYTFGVLRYMHDPVTQEFVNIGIAVLCKEIRYLNVRCEIHYGRISKVFGKIDGDRFRQATRYIEDRLQKIAQEIHLGLPFEKELRLEGLVSRVLPPDDSAFQFAGVGGGLSANPDETLDALFSRLVERYAVPMEGPHRDDDDVWKVYREPLERHKVISRLTPKKITAPNFAYEFAHSWKNERWHVYEAVSFDLIEPNSILDKANRWLGRGTSLADSKEGFKMHLLLGSPSDPSLKSAYQKAQNILHKIPSGPELVNETEAEEFAADVAQQLKDHDEEHGGLR